MPERTRQRRNERLANPPSLRLTPRDRAVIRAVYDYRILSQEQIRRLVFADCDASVAKRRLYKLYHHHFLDRRFLPVLGGIVHSPILYVLDRAGRELLRKKDPQIRWTRADNTVSPLFIDHTLAISDMRIALSLACRSTPDIRLTAWKGEREMQRDQGWGKVRGENGLTHRVSVIPDSFFTLEMPTPAGTPQAFFALELDRGTMELKRFKRKISAYLHYLESGGYTEQYGTKSLRILTVTENSGRLAQLKRVTESAGGKSRFWFTTRAEMTSENVLHAPIWQIAGQSERACLVRETEKVNGVAAWMATPLIAFTTLFFLC